MKKFIVKFGYFLTEDETETSDEEKREIKEKKTTNQKDILKPHKETEKIIKQDKEKILLLLKKDPSVSKIFPLENNLEIKNLFALYYFGEPIKFKIKLPFKNQDISQGESYRSELKETDEFNILLHQHLFAIYQEVPTTKLDFSGGPDVREKIGKILEEIFPNLRFVAPTPFRDRFVYLVSYEDKSKIANEMKKYEGDFVHTLDDVDFEEEIYRIFWSYEFHLRMIYHTYNSYHRINAKASEIIETQKKLKRLFRDFVNSNLLNIIIHNKNKPIKQFNQKLCELLLDYILSVNMYEKNLSQTNSIIDRRDYPLKNYLEKLESETNIYIKINVDAMFKYTESIFNELNTKSINISTISSGIIGGVIGAIGTIIITLIR